MAQFLRPLLHPLSQCILSGILMWFMYLKWFFEYASGTTWSTNLEIAAVLSAALTCLWAVRTDEIKEIVLVEARMGRHYKPGYYILVNPFPFLRGIHLNLGFALALVASSRIQPEISARNFFHHLDTRDTRSNVNLSTTSFLAMNVNRLSTSFFSWLFTFTDEYGQFEYYKLGRIAFLGVLLAATLGNFISPAQKKNIETQAPSSRNWIEEKMQGFIPSPAQVSVKVTVQLEKSPPPKFPYKAMFAEGNRDVFLTSTEDGVKYVRYSPSYDGSIPAMKVLEPLCALVPAGEKVGFVTNRVPTNALNMVDRVIYSRRIKYLDWDEWLYLRLHHNELLEQSHIRTFTTWEKLHNTWKGVNKNFSITAEALPQTSMPKSSTGGLVCFL